MDIARIRGATEVEVAPEPVRRRLHCVAVRFLADLHVHSHLSRATSKELDLEHLYCAAQRKGITVVATGDFTHPRWLRELRDKLVPAEPGLFAIRDDLARALDEQVTGACRGPVRFILSVEISSIYKQGGRVRKVHNLVYAPDFECAASLGARLATIGNIEADGRPILGLESRNLLEIVLASSPDAFLIPAHVWTPWFSALGAQSGFDSIDECFGDFSSHVFAIETGLSSDPAMNWRLSQLDRFALVSNSDAHSPDKLGREANVFDCELSYFALRDALRSAREGLVGTVEFFPEEGKYHFDGHRACGVVLSPSEARAACGICPQCGKRLTAGVAGRIEQLADRAEGFRPATAKAYSRLVPLAELIGELVDAGTGSEKVRRAYAQALDRVGPELRLLTEVDEKALDGVGIPLLSEAVRRVRRGEVEARAGFDGEYGTVRAFTPDERRRLLAQQTFHFALAPARPRSQGRAARAPAPPREPDAAAATPAPDAAAATPAPELAPTMPGASAPVPGSALSTTSATSDSARLNAEQVAAVQHVEGPLLILAGPGTGKTRTLTHRIAHLVAHGACALSEISAITFTRKAAEELRHRLGELLGSDARTLQACTFHALGLELLRECPASVGLAPGFPVWGEAERMRAVEAAIASLSESDARVTAARAAQRISWEKAHGRASDVCDVELGPVYRAYEQRLTDEGAVDFDDLIVRCLQLLETDAGALERARRRCRHLLVDEYQDINLAQYRLVRLLAPAAQQPNLCAVGDPDQAIYGFRGSAPRYFDSFSQDYPGARVIALSQNYRSSAAVVRASTAVIEAAAGRTPRPLEPLAPSSPPVEWVCTGSDSRRGRDGRQGDRAGTGRHDSRCVRRRKRQRCARAARAPRNRRAVSNVRSGQGD